MRAVVERQGSVAFHFAREPERHQPPQRLGGDFLGRVTMLTLLETDVRVVAVGTPRPVRHGRRGTAAVALGAMIAGMHLVLEAGQLGHGLRVGSRRHSESGHHRQPATREFQPSNRGHGVPAVTSGTVSA